jgi:hypothetical protein
LRRNDPIRSGRDCARDASGVGSAPEFTTYLRHRVKRSRCASSRDGRGSGRRVPWFRHRRRRLAASVLRNGLCAKLYKIFLPVLDCRRIRFDESVARSAGSVTRRACAASPSSCVSFVE